MLEFGFQYGETRYHEAQKPLDLLKFLVKLTTKEGQVVLDPFMGSGTTALAAKKLHRNYIGFEISPDYCGICDERLQYDEKVQQSTKILERNLLF